jgi:hypothetical protein
MEQEPVIFSATILDPMGREPVAPLPPVVEEPREALDEAKDTFFEPLCTPPPLTRQCCLPRELEHPHERFERHSELADALPSIFIAFGIAYALGVLTGGMIFSSPSMIEAL